MATKKPMTPFISTTRNFESSKKDTEKKAPGKEGSKREERYDVKQSKKK